jgi:lipoprotein-anchoring transpeptidase ErfK/SrfK
MFHPIRLWLLALIVLAHPGLAEVGGARLAAEDAESLETLFSRAADDTDAVVPLLEAASKRLIDLPAERAAALAVRLEPFSRRAFLGHERLDDMADIGLVLHRVAPGESASGIARRYHITVDLIALLNKGFAPSSLQAGSLLKVLDLRDESLELVVGCSSFRMLVWRDGILVMTFPVGLGAAAHPTPLGTTSVVACVRNPEWRDPDTGKVYRPDAPGNVLGGYWIGFAPGPGDDFHGIGIHGYTAESPDGWLGKQGSHGCVRMQQRDISALFALVRPGTRVAIRP